MTSPVEGRNASGARLAGPTTRDPPQKEAR